MITAEQAFFSTKAFEVSHGFHVMLKPVGPICNLDCEYCYYLDKEELYPEKGGKVNAWRMSEETLEAFVRQYIEGQPHAPEISFGFQGGEATLLGIEFYRKAVAFQKKYARRGQRITNMLQTNGTLLDDAWGEFLAENDFLVGISIDGPAELHDKYRYDKAKRGSHASVMRGLRVLQRHGVDYNVLCVLNRENSQYPLEVYKFFKENGVRFIQFIPIVEPVGLGTVTQRSILPEQYGAFLSAVFDEWVKHDVGYVFVNMFDVALQAFAGEPSSLCVHAETCGAALAMEHNGDVYACDHFVEPRYLRGNIHKVSLPVLADMGSQHGFGLNKREGLPTQCRECSVRFVCHGGCPKDRILRTRSGEAGLNYLCAGYKQFFTHVEGPMREMVGYLRQGIAPSAIMAGV